MRYALSRPDAPFRVAGGPFASEQRMGWHVTDHRGFTVGVACDGALAERLNRLEELADALYRIEAGYWLLELFDEGKLPLDRDGHALPREDVERIAALVASLWERPDGTEAAPR